MDGLDIYSYDGENYDPTMHFGAWRVAFLNHGDRFTRGKITYLERHMLTDEVFVLRRGAATLLIGPTGEQVTVEPNRIYNVRAGVWHSVITEPGTRMLVVENHNTSRDNSEYMDFRA